MPLTLKFNQLLVAEASGSAVVHLEDGQKLVVRTGNIMHEVQNRFHSNKRRTTSRSFMIQIASLAKTTQKEIKADINRLQQKIHDDTPDFVTKEWHGGGLLPSRDHRGRLMAVRRKPPAPKRIPVEKPPRSLTIDDSYALHVLAHATYNGSACLEVGEKLVVHAQKPFADKHYTIGTITALTLT